MRIICDMPTSKSVERRILEAALDSLFHCSPVLKGTCFRKLSEVFVRSRCLSFVACGTIFVLCFFVFLVYALFVCSVVCCVVRSS